MPQLTDLPVSCRCGAVRGTVIGASPAVGTHLVCYCRDCRAYARHLGDAAALDAVGGTELFQTSAGRLQLHSGEDRVACLRMTRRGPLRWYAGCCGSAIANTPPVAAVPFAGLVVARIDGDRKALGPIVARVFTDSAEPGHAPRRFGMAQVALRFLRVTVAARLAGDQRRHPFFPDGRPLAPASLLSAADRRAAYR